MLSTLAQQRWRHQARQFRFPLPLQVGSQSLADDHRRVEVMLKAELGKPPFQIGTNGFLVRAEAAETENGRRARADVR